MATVEISTSEQFIALKDMTDRGTADAPLDIVFTNDLDFSEIGDFEGLGNVILYANLNGNGHAIKNLVTNSGSDFYLMGHISNGTIKNIVIDNCHISVNGVLRIFCSQYCNYENIVIKNSNTFVTSSELYVIYGSSSRGSTLSKIAIGGTYNCNRYFGIRTTSVVEKISNCYVVANIICSGECCTFGYIDSCNGFFNCFTRCNITHTSTDGNYYGFYHNYYTIKIMYCYAANTIDGTFKQHYNFSNGTITTACFYDSTLDTVTQTGGGLPATTAQLKSAEWLRSQGWAI